MAKQTLEQLEKENADLKTALEAAEKNAKQNAVALEDALAVNDKLAAKIEALEKQASAAPAVVSTNSKSFTRNKKTYAFTSPKCKHGETVITPEMVCADEQLQDELIAMGSGFIVEQ